MSTANARTTTAYKTRLARTIMGEALALTPATVVIGNGAFDTGANSVRPPGEAMYNQTASYPLSVTLSGATVRAHASVASGNAALTYSEIGVVATDGTLILHRTLPPQVIGAGITVNFDIDLLPPEVS